MAIAKYAVAYKAKGLIFMSICPGVVNTAVAPRKCPCVRPSSRRQPVNISPITNDRGAAEILPRPGKEDSSSLPRIQGCDFARGVG